MKPVKVQWGANEHILEGFINFRNETDGDITKPLKFGNESVDFILLSHVLEHVSHKNGYKFLREAHRILKPGGVIRVTVPDLDKVWRLNTDAYKSMVAEGIKTWWPAIGWTPPLPGYVPSERELIEALIFCHGHEAVYTAELLGILMEASGFDCCYCEYGFSLHEEFEGADQHHVYMGWENCAMESAVVEGTKP